MAIGRGFVFYSSGRCYGAAIAVQGRLHVLCICRRGIFWRFGGRIFSPVRGYWEAMFGLRYSTTATYSDRPGINLFLTVGMRDERILVRCRPRGIHGAIYFSRTGCISLKFAELDSTIFSPIEYRAYQSTTQDKEIEDIRGDENIEGEY